MSHHAQASSTPRIGTPRDHARDRLVRETHAELTVTAVCPICRGPLVARCHPVRGPYFHCACAKSAAPEVKVLRFEDRRPIEDRGQRTEDRGQKTTVGLEVSS